MEMNRPSILFIAPSCYPIDGAEANVNAKVIKALTEYGCNVDLVSRKSSKSLCYPQSRDDYYFGKIRQIEEVDWYIKKDIKRIWNHVKVFLLTGYTYVWADWAYPAIKACEELIAKNHYDYIYTYNAPSEIVGLYLSKKYRIKWVATWNDPYCWNKYPAPYGEGIKGKVSYFRNKIIRNIGKYTYFNIFPSERLRSYMMKYVPGIDKENTAICPHLVLSDQKFKSCDQNKELNILHAGALGKERNPMTLLVGLSQFLKSMPNAKIHLNFLGVFERMDTFDVENFIKKNELFDYINIIPPVPYTESLSIIAKNDVCLLVEAPCEEGIFLPSKVADYMQIGKPIFAISPSVGTMKDMYVTKQIDYFADVKDPMSIANEFNRIYNDFNNQTLHFGEYDTFQPINYIEIQQNKIWRKKK